MAEPARPLTGGGTVRQGSAGSAYRFTFALQGFEKVDVGLSRMMVALDDWTEFFRDWAAPQFFDDVQLNFDSQGKYVEPWPALSPAYAEWKAQHYPGRPMLVRKGDLKRSLSWSKSSSSLGAGGIARFSAKRAEMGSSLPTATWHQFGTRKPTIAPRVFEGRRSPAYLARLAAERLRSGRSHGGYRMPPRRVLFLKTSQTYGRLMQRYLQHVRDRQADAMVARDGSAIGGRYL